MLQIASCLIGTQGHIRNILAIYFSFRTISSHGSVSAIDTTTTPRINSSFIFQDHTKTYHHHTTNLKMDSTQTTKIPTFASHLSSLAVSPPFLGKERYDERSNNDANVATHEIDYNIIIGNEAGDADSIISALALSYIYRLEGCVNAIPVVSIPREDIMLRRDVTVLLSISGVVELEKLLYLDDDFVQGFLEFDNRNLIKKKRPLITLVDHNRIKSDLDHFSNDIVEIIDHHDDEFCHLSVADEKRLVEFKDGVALVGSTCTLVTERLERFFFRNQQTFLNEESGAENNDMVKYIDPGISLALLGVILLDTMNMNQKAEKGTIRDANAINFLLKNTRWYDLVAPSSPLNQDVKTLVFPHGIGTAPNQEALYNCLAESKFDRKFWEGLSVRDFLRLDYKRFEGDGQNIFGLSSVLLPMSSFLSKINFMNDTYDFMKKMNISILGVMSIVIVDNEPCRELILLGSNDDVNHLSDYLLNSDSTTFLDISIKKTTIDNDLNNSNLYWKCFHQGNPKGSRKQLAPALLNFFSSL